MADQRLRLAVDIGGTFTDVVLDGAGQRQTTKVLTTHVDPADGVLQGIRRVLGAAGARPGDVGLVLHGTTLATNALIERRGAVTALLTTEGHRDAVEMAFENRFEQYDIDIDRPQPLVPRPLRLPVTERLAADGSVLRALDLASVERWLPLLDSRGVASIAVGFLHSYVNAEHEQAVGALLRAALPSVAVTLSSEVCPEIREYERLSTTCANAYIKPLMARYLASLARQLAELGVGCPVLLMTSGGGLTTLETAAEFPIRLVESGPAGGAMLAARVAAEGGYDRVLSFDMGGTTAKICLIDDASPLLSRAFEVDRVYRFKKGSGLPVRVPVIEMVEIGAGGGSIASIDKLGRIQVGPASAGSEPGPACYGRGGDRPTVTDADLILGRMDPAGFAGGSMALDAAAAERTLAATLGTHLDRDAVATAYAVGAVVDENMAAAARAHASEWGTDVASRTLVAFGGAAPLHAASLADRLHIDRVVIPAGAGVGSAIGFLLAPVSYEVVRSRYQRLSAFEPEAANELLAAMHEEAAAVVRAAAPDDHWREERRAYMRYLGQGYEIAVPVVARPLAAGDAEVLREAFEAEYRRLYGRLIPGLDVELMSWTLTLLAREPDPPQALPEPAPVRLSAGGTGRLYDADAEGTVPVAVHRRADLAPGHCAAGPALVIEDQTTTVVPSGFELRVDARGHLLLERRQEAAS